MTTQRPTTDTADVQAPQAAPEPAVAPQGTAAPGGQRSAFDVTDLNLFYGGFHAVKDVNMAIERNKVTAFIGSSGCGKSTVLRSLNRMHEVIRGARAEGRVLLEGEDIYHSSVDPVLVRR